MNLMGNSCITVVFELIILRYYHLSDDVLTLTANSWKVNVIIWSCDEEGYVVHLERIIKLKKGRKVNPTAKSTVHLWLINRVHFNHYAAILVPPNIPPDKVKSINDYIKDYETNLEKDLKKK